MKGRRLVLGAANWVAIAGWLTCIAVLATIVAGFIIVGGPAQARQEKADEQRVTDLTSLTQAVRRFYGNHKKLPATLDAALKDSPGTIRSAKDPETEAAYEYRVIDPKNFELCATFQTDQSKANYPGYYNYGGETLPFWKHGLGRQCFKLSSKESFK